MMGYNKRPVFKAGPQMTPLDAMSTDGEMKKSMHLRLVTYQ